MRHFVQEWKNRCILVCWLNYKEIRRYEKNKWGRHGNKDEHVFEEWDLSYENESEPMYGFDGPLLINLKVEMCC